MTFNEYEKIGAFISGAGFAVFVAVWFLLKTDRRLEALTAAIIELKVCLRNIFGEGGSYGKSEKS